MDTRRNIQSGRHVTPKGSPWPQWQVSRASSSSITFHILHWTAYSSSMLSSTKLVKVPSRNPPASALSVPHTPRAFVPYVYVFPPEEERAETPPWCCFNPADDASDYSDEGQDNSDVQFIDVALEFMNDHAGDDANVAPIFSRASMDEAVEEVRSTRKAEKRSNSVRNFMSYGSSEGRQHGGRELPEDVVEVFKVRRSESNQEVAPTARTKRSKSFKMPFQKALRSIKNVGRGSSSRKPSAKGIPASASIGAKPAEPLPQEEIVPTPSPSRSASPMLTRKPSHRLVQMFSIKNHSNADLITTLADPSQLASSSQSSPQLASTSQSSSQLASSSQSSSQLRNTPSPVVVDDLGVFVSDPSQPKELAPSVASRTSSKRFSVHDLHRVFSFSSSAPAPGEEPQETPRPSQDAASLPTLSHEDSSDPSTTSEESAHPPSEPPTPSSKIHWRTSAEMRLSSADVPQDEDVSFEMRLDSLQFDSLSFDADEFDVSIALDGLRRA